MSTAIVCGGRDYADRDALFATLDRLRANYGIAAVAHGGAPGADTLAGQWAKSRGLVCEEFRADWKRQGRAAGPLRNQRMLDDAGARFVVAFPGGDGTADMVRRARAKGLAVVEVAS
jgi:predicted Rossmann-fold nucleotide-binding protein